MRDLLIRYLLGELDDAQQRQLEARVRESADLRRELEYLRGCFGGPSVEGPTPIDEPPPDLARRTAEHIGSLDDKAPFPPAASLAAATEAPPAPVTWSLADISVAAGVFLAVSMLVLPAMRGSRDTARKVGCAKNQSDLGYVLARYAADHRGYFPRVGARETVGIFAARLVDEGYITAEDLKARLICRASKLGDEVAAGRYVIHIPSVAQLKAAEGAELDRLLRRMVFSYAYRIGYVEDNRYNPYCLKSKRRMREPILADAPMFGPQGPIVDNHKGNGLNVLFDDGSVKFFTDPVMAEDKIYLNRLNRPAAGRGAYDIVLGISGATPQVEVIEVASE
jgi:hypothetical protein